LPFGAFFYIISCTIMYGYPEQTATRYDIKTKHGKISFMFEQAMAQETDDYIQIINNLNESDTIEDKFRWYKQESEYRNNKLNKSLMIKKGLLNKRKQKRQLNLVKKYFENYKDEIFAIIHKFWVSKYADMPTAQPKNSKDPVFNWSFWIISDATGLSVCDVPLRLTKEQIWRRFDKLTYEYYDSFKEWQIINSRVRGKMNKEWKYKELLDYMGR